MRDALRPDKVDIDLACEGSRIHSVRTTELDIACAGDDDLDRTERCLGRGDELVDRCGVGDVE